MKITSPSAPGVFLSGGRIGLRPFVEEDINDRYLSWFNDAEACFYNEHHLFPYTVQEAKDYLRGVNRLNNYLFLAIVHHEDREHIGNVALSQIHAVHHSAELSIMIGEKKYWGQGYGREACRLICDHGFGALNLRRIYCGTLVNHRRMRKLAESLGMREEGIRVQAMYKNGAYVDMIEYGMLKEEYRL